MLKNELEILATGFIHLNRSDLSSRKQSDAGFSKIVSESCGQAREAWAAAAFSVNNNERLRRYFNFHFRFLCSLITEELVGNQHSAVLELFYLMDHLLLFYGDFIEQQQPVPKAYVTYRLQAAQQKYRQFMDAAEASAIGNALQKCLAESLGPIYGPPPAENLDLGALLYREKLIEALAGKRNSAELLTNDSVIATLFAFNFNHFLFLNFLREEALAGLKKLTTEQYPDYILKLKFEVPSTDAYSQLSFDIKWPNIGVMYKSWLDDYALLFDLSGRSLTKSPSVSKVPLAVSVKFLGCLVRVLYESGFYGNISLTAVFEHTASNFSTKMQSHISPRSLSNAYYEIDQSSALKMTRMFNRACEFLKPYCLPG